MAIVHRVVDDRELKELTANGEWEFVEAVGGGGGMEIMHPFYGPRGVVGAHFLIRRGETPGFSELEKQLAQLKSELEGARQSLTAEREMHRATQQHANKLAEEARELRSQLKKQSKR